MRILFLGDIVGRSGRDVIEKQLPQLRQQLKIDAVIVNGENAAAGFGITGQICKSLYQVGVDIITTGNHIWDQREIMQWISTDHKLIRPINFPSGSPGKGSFFYQTKNGERLLVINAMGRLYMDPLDDPFAAIDKELSAYRLGGNVDAIFVDFHAEASSEKMALAHYLDGRVSAVIGTHTHVPTADHQILPAGTAYQTDAGMCGDYNSVIGMDKTSPIQRFTRKLPTDRLVPATGIATLCGVLIETHKNGLAKNIYPIRLNGRLQPTNLDVIST